MEKINEEWRDVLGYEGRYQISSLGKVRFPVRVNKKMKLPVKDPPDYAIMKVSKNAGNGYYAANLCKDGSLTRVAVHRLVALAFIDRVVGKEYVNHKNGDRLDNRAVNLEWCTQSENLLHSVRVLGKINNQRGRKGVIYSTSRKIIAIKGNERISFRSIQIAADALKVGQGNIGSVLRNRRMTTGGYQFIYDEN